MYEEDEQQQELLPGPGQILRRAREKANLSSQDIADKIKLKKSLIEDLEIDNYDINISLTFIKGYIKLYAKYVDVPESEVMVAFDNLNTQKKEPAKLQSFSRRIANQANDDKLMLVTYLIIAVVIALVVIWWWQQSDVDDTSSAESKQYQPETELVVEQTPVVVEAPAELAIEELSEDSTELPKFNQQDQQANPQQDVDELPTPSSEQAVPEVNTQAGANVDTNMPPANSLSELAEPIELVFEFSDDCWMSLTDATGEDIAYGVKKKGRVMSVTGIPPFTVTLGAPEVVQIQFAGEPLDMSFISPGRIAKFTLPLSE
ncbi:RodZ domain-containing protein [Paraglaciecola aestuariivivens]